MTQGPDHIRAAREREQMIELENRLIVASIADPTAGMTRKQRRKYDAEMRRDAKRLPKSRFEPTYQSIGDEYVQAKAAVPLKGGE